jgi:hypothetical protein
VPISTYHREDRKHWTQNWIRRNNLPYRFLVDSRDYRQNISVNVFEAFGNPDTWIIDRSGRAVWRKTGFNPGEEKDIEEMVRLVLGWNPD